MCTPVRITLTSVIPQVSIDLQPLLANSKPFSGWLPVHDTIRGVCGDVFVSIRVEVSCVAPLFSVWR